MSQQDPHSDSDRKDSTEMTTQPMTEEQPVDLTKWPPLPTEEERAAQAARAAEEADRAARQAEEDRRAAKTRLLEMARRLEQKGSNIGQDRDANGEPHPEAWNDLSELQAQATRRRWWASIEDAHLTELAGWTLDDMDGEAELAQRQLRRFLAQLHPTTRNGRRGRVEALKLNCVVSGNVGAGKTAAALAAGHEAIERGMSVQVVSHTRYLSMLRRGGQPQGKTLEQVLSFYRNPDVCQLLILDDFGAEYDVPGETGDRPVRPVWEEDSKATLALVGDRLNSGLATIYTTNLTAAQVKTMFGARTYSRIGDSAVGVKIIGQDRRKPLEW